MNKPPSRGYKTLPSAFRRSDDGRKSGKKSGHSSASSPTPNGGDHGPLFGIGMNIGNLISGGMQFFGQLGRRKQNSSSMSPPPRSTSISDRFGTESTTLVSEIKERFGHSTATSACVSELIEMTNISPASTTLAPESPTPVLAEGETEQVGKGHDFHPVGTFNPTWCDLCRDLVWGLYDTGAARCIRCHLTCHQKCQQKIKLNCVTSLSLSFNQLKGKGTTPLLQSQRSRSLSSSSTDSADDLDRDESTLANISTLKDEEEVEVPRLKSRLLEERVYLGDDQLKVHVVHVSEDEESDDENKTLRDVSAIEDFAVDVGTSTDVEEEEIVISGHSDQFALCSDVLYQAIEKYNKLCPPGQTTVGIEPEGSQKSVICRGYIRVSLNLRRPIHVLPGTRPPSTYNLMTSNTLTASESNKTLTSFFLPQDTVKALHLTSLTTVHDVIRTLLSKFRVVDNPHKFALYEKNSCLKRKDSFTSQHHSVGREDLRKLLDDEKPLLLALSRSLEENSGEESVCYFVLQENDPGEICWESFSLPELKNFLLILDREEAWYKRRIHEKYGLVQETMQNLLDEKRSDLNDESASSSGV